MTGPGRTPFAPAPRPRCVTAWGVCTRCSLPLISTRVVNYQLPAELPEPRFSLIGSGLYAEVVWTRAVWRCEVAARRAPPVAPRPRPSATRFRSTHAQQPRPLLTSHSASVGTAWRRRSALSTGSQKSCGPRRRAAPLPPQRLGAGWARRRLIAVAGAGRDPALRASRHSAVAQRDYIH